MKVVQAHFKNNNFDPSGLEEIKGLNPQIAFVFANIGFFEDGSIGQKIREALPNCEVVGCSTAGEITGKGVFDNSLSISALNLENPNFKVQRAPINAMEESEDCGKALGAALKADDLTGVLVFGQGVNINGSGIIRGIQASVGTNIPITGGLAGDSGNFSKTYTLHNDSVLTNEVVGVGIYGDKLKIGYGSMGGWEAFGPVRKVTKVDHNVLYELDGEPALETYKSYLGDHAKGLPASGLLFPLAVLNDEQDESGLVRTILDVNEGDGSITLAGELQVNKSVRLMKTDGSGLVDGAKGAAQKTFEMIQNKNGDGFGILVSCIGRKLVLSDEIDDEVDAVNEVFKGTPIAGFYSNGEICPHFESTDCKLHNQTMTITYLFEV